MEEKILEELASIKTGLAEVITNQEKEDLLNDEFTFRTRDEHKAKVITNMQRLVGALEDLRQWRYSLYKGYDNTGKYYMTEGYTENFEGKQTPVEIPEHDDYSNYDTETKQPGKTKYMTVLEYDYVFDKIDSILKDNDIWAILGDE